MEIRIHSAGKEIGPYSESQVRQYLSEGLISASDPAFADGMSEWLPTEQLLARLASPDAPSESANGSDNGGESPRAIQVRATAATRTKRGPIVLQPIFAGESAGQRRSRTGPTALTIEAPRPTTQLPPVAKFVPKEDRKPSKGMVETGPLAPSRFFDRQPEEHVLNAPTTPPEPETDLLVTGEPAEPTPTPEPDVPPRETPAPEVREEHREEHHEEPRHFSRAIWYLSIAAGVIGFGFLVALAYFIWRVGTPAPHDAQSMLTPTPTSLDITADVSATPHGAADYVARGHAREEKGDLNGALADYDEAVALDPRNAEALYHRAVSRQTKGNWDGALADYNSLLAIEPDNADAYSNRGYVKQTKGDIDGALADYTEALSRKPTIAEAFYNVGLIKERRGDIDGGIAAFDKAIDLDPKLARVYYNRGNAKNTEGNVDGAIADYTQAVEIDPANAMAFLNRGTARQGKGDAAGALADFSQAIAVDANLAPAYRGRGEIELQRGDFNAAQADSSHALTLAPTDAPSLFNRGLAELGLHDLDHAGADFSKFCEAAPRDPGCDSARLFLWVVAAEQNARAKADDELNYALINNWNSSPEDLTSKIASFLVGHIREDELLTDAAAPDPSLVPGRQCRVLYFAGVRRLVTGDAAIAIIYFQKALATSQKDCHEYVFARTQLVALGQSREASSQLAPTGP